MANEKSFWAIIKNATQKFIESEKTTAGKVNFFFGVLIFILIFLICVPSWLEVIIKIFIPDFNDLIPWYGILIMFTLGVFYFYFCSTRLIEIDKTKKGSKS